MGTHGAKVFGQLRRLLTTSLITVFGFTFTITAHAASLVAWGSGPGTNAPPLTNVIAIAAASAHVLALQSDGVVRAWGNNAYFESTVPGGVSNVIAVAAGFYHSLALKSDGSVAAWGRNTYGQSTVPPDLSNVIAIA